MSELKPCPFCGDQPSTYWDYTSEEDECYNEGYNIVCCVVHVSEIYKDEAVEHWNTRRDYRIQQLEAELARKDEALGEIKQRYFNLIIETLAETIEDNHGLLDDPVWSPLWSRLKNALQIAELAKKALEGREK